jgi:hypothetical protein
MINWCIGGCWFTLAIKEDHVKVPAATTSNCLLQSDGLSHYPPKAPLDGGGRLVGSRK